MTKNLTTCVSCLNRPVFFAIKRAMDIIASLLVISCVLTWLIPLVFIIRKVFIGGKVFFVQERTGLGSKTFRCFKFRTFENDGGENELIAVHQAQTTRFGRFMRTVNLDELPQFFNVLGGSMSLIGPRPHMLYHTVLYSERLKKYPLRHCVKPGITGLAQSRGFRGEISSEADMRARLKADLMYIERLSPSLECYIVRQSFATLLITFLREIRLLKNPYKDTTAAS